MPKRGTAAVKKTQSKYIYLTDSGSTSTSNNSSSSSASSENLVDDTSHSDKQYDRRSQEIPKDEHSLTAIAGTSPLTRDPTRQDPERTVQQRAVELSRLFDDDDDDKTDNSVTEFPEQLPSCPPARSHALGPVHQHPAPVTPTTKLPLESSPDSPRRRREGGQARPHTLVEQSKGSMSYIPPSQQRNMRACMVCSIIRTQSQFLQSGCPNCESFLELTGNSDAVAECTSQVFDGMLTVSDTSRSWVARYQRLEGYVAGVYAIQVEGVLPEEVVSAAESAGVHYVPRDGSVSESLPTDG